jgi:predicted metal-binding membrane protein
MPGETKRQDKHALTLRPVGVTAGLAVVTALGWAVVVDRRGAAMGMGMGMGKGVEMRTGMGTGGVDAAAFLGVWVAMVAAMMLPTIQPMVVTYRALFRDDLTRTRWSRMAAFLVPYAVLWMIAGTGALGLWSIGRDHPVVAGSLVAIAGLYQLGTIKTRCLRWCRSPLGFLVRFGGNARSMRGAAALGTRHGAVCFGCCAGLMVGLTGAGVMSISWLVALGLLMLLEKTHRAGQSLAKMSGVALLALGAATAVVPFGQLTSEATGLGAIAVLGIVALATRRRIFAVA